jgi:uncharacterized membrane protein
MQNNDTPRAIQWDLIYTGIITFLITLQIYLFPPLNWLNALRLALGLPFVLFLPGYWFIGTLFPQRDDLDTWERIGLSLALSVAWISILALILDRLPWGLQLWTILFGEQLFIFFFMGITLARRVRLSPKIAYIPKPIRARKWWQAQLKQDQRMYLTLLGIVSLALIAVSWVFLVPSPASFITEFYILGPDGLAENFPREAAIGDMLTVTMGITNKEGEDHEYYIEVWEEDPLDENHRSQVGDLSKFTLQSGQNIEFPIHWSMLWAGDDQIVDFLLFIDNQPEPYRNIRLWLNVTEAKK